MSDTGATEFIKFDVEKRIGALPKPEERNYNDLEVQLLSLLKAEVVANGDPAAKKKAIEGIAGLVDKAYKPDADYPADTKKPSEISNYNIPSLKEQADDTRLEPQKTWEKTDTEKVGTVEDWVIEGNGEVAQMGREIQKMRETMREISEHVARYNEIIPMMKGLIAPPESESSKALDIKTTAKINALSGGPLFPDFLDPSIEGKDFLDLQKKYEEFLNGNNAVNEREMIVEPASLDKDGKEIPAKTEKRNVVGSDVTSNEAFMMTWAVFKESANTSPIESASLRQRLREKMLGAEKSEKSFAEKLDEKRDELIKMQQQIKEVARLIQIDNLKHQNTFNNETPPENNSSFLEASQQKMIDEMINEPNLTKGLSGAKVAMFIALGFGAYVAGYAVKHGIEQAMDDTGLEGAKGAGLKGAGGMDAMTKMMLMKRGMSYHDVEYLDRRLQKANAEKAEKEEVPDVVSEPVEPVPAPTATAIPPTPAPAIPTP